MSASLALTALIETIRTGCAAHFGNRVHDFTPGDAARDGADPEIANGLLRCWLGPMNVAPDAGCGAFRATLRLYCGGFTASRAPVWDAALALMALLDGATHDDFGGVAILRPAADVIDAGDGVIEVAIDIGFTIPA